MRTLGKKKKMRIIRKTVIQLNIKKDHFQDLNLLPIKIIAKVTGRNRDQIEALFPTGGIIDLGVPQNQRDQGEKGDINIKVKRIKKQSLGIRNILRGQNQKNRLGIGKDLDHVLSLIIVLRGEKEGKIIKDLVLLQKEGASKKRDM